MQDHKCTSGHLVSLTPVHLSPGVTLIILITKTPFQVAKALEVTTELLRTVSLVLVNALFWAVLYGAVSKCSKTWTFLFALYDSSICDFLKIKYLHVAKATVKDRDEELIRNKHQKRDSV